MAEKDIASWVAGVAGVSAILTMFTAFIQKQNNSKELAKLKKDWEVDVGSQNAKIKENTDRINTIEMTVITRLDKHEDHVITRLDKHEDHVDAKFMTAKEVNLKFANLAQINTLQSEQILKVQESQSVQIDNIFKLLTKMRDQQIADLKKGK